MTEKMVSIRYSKKHEIKVHLPPQRLNHCVNGFVECIRGVCRYLNEPKSIQNGLVLIENYQCDLVVGKSGSELQFEPEPPRTGPEVRFKVQKFY